MGWSKEERADYMKKYRKENRDQINSNRRYYYRQNREYEIFRQNEYLKEHPEVRKKWIDKNKDKVRAYQREYKREHPEIHENWLSNNRERWNEYQRKYKKEQRERRKNDSTGTFGKSKCDRKESVSTCKETRQIANS